MSARQRPRHVPLLTTLALALAALGAGCSAHTHVADLMHESWTVVKEYEQDPYTYYVVREGHRYAKIVQLPSAPVYTLYEVDVLTRNCKWGDVLIDCAGLQHDPDLGPLLTWLGPMVGTSRGRSLPPDASTPAPAPTGTSASAEPTGENPFVLPGKPKSPKEPAPPRRGAPTPSGKPPSPSTPPPLDETW